MESKPTVIDEEEPKKQWLTEVMQELGVAEYGETGKSTRDLTRGFSPLCESKLPSTLVEIVFVLGLVLSAVVVASSSFLQG